MSWHCDIPTSSFIHRCVFTAIACDDSNICTDDSCDSSTGGCIYTQNTAPCEDGNIGGCTQNDTCSGGVCVGGPEGCPGSADPCLDNTCQTLIRSARVAATMGCVLAPKSVGDQCFVSGALCTVHVCIDTGTGA
jgi:slime mold repeat-containing protein